MRASKRWLSLGLMAAACCAICHAQQLIYSNAFNGAAITINGTAPTLANAVAGGSNNATWICTYTNDVPAPTNGTVLGNGDIATNAGCALLPFTPHSGCIYFMTASLTVPSPMGEWVAMGFTQTSRQTNNAGYARFNDNPGPQGYGWMNAIEGSSDQLFGGPRTSIASPAVLALPGAGTYTLQIILNTLGANWTVSTYVNAAITGTNVVGGVQIGTNLVYSSNPPIGFAGIGQTSFAHSSVAGIQWNYWTLSTALLPEISQQPVPAAVNAGAAFTNSVSAIADVDSGPLCYQWFTNGIAIGDATNASLVLDPVSTNDAGVNFDVVVTNDYGSVTSAVTSLTVLTTPMTNDAPIQLTSPDGSLSLIFAVSNFDGSLNCPVYSVSRDGRTLVTPSKLGLTFDAGGLLQQNLGVLSESESSSSNTWQPVYAERSPVCDNYNQLIVNLQELIAPYRLLQLTFRAYNEGVAFRYTIPSQTGLVCATNLTEQTEFRFGSDYPAWATYTAEGLYSQTTISGITSGCERPLPIELATNLYVALGEAGLVDYSRMKFAPLEGKTDSLVSLLDAPVTSALPLTTPWRFIMAADSPGKLLENDFLVLNLNDPCALTNTSWIKPGKVIRETTLTTAGALACVNFAASHNISYIEFDAGWYGPENTTPTATNVISSLNMPGIVSYAASNNVGVILYVNWLAMTNELTLLPPLYSSWGVKGIKYGFVSVGPQKFTETVNAAARICASNQMMLDVHDEFRPSGYTRTYPNFMTVEGVAGDETTPTAAQDTTTLFSRMLVGGADHTVCYFDSRVTNWSYAYQLAKAVCFYSPWQFIYWYDRPTNSPGYVSGGDDMITEVPEMEFYDYMPTVWDETRVLQSSIGQYAIIARRSGAQWFIGAMNANSTRTFTVPLSFLTPGQKYVENLYSQDPSVPTRTHVRIDRSIADSTSTLSITLGPSSGIAARLLPAVPPAIQSISPLSNGGFELTATGSVSLPFSLWSSSDLNGTNWTLLTDGLITNNPWQWNDIPAQPQRFYRFSTP